jgi:hypothetical protein
MLECNFAVTNIDKTTKMAASVKGWIILSILKKQVSNWVQGLQTIISLCTNRLRERENLASTAWCPNS